MKKIISIIIMIFTIQILFSQVETKTIFNSTGTTYFYIQSNPNYQYIISDYGYHSLTFKSNAYLISPNSWTGFGNSTYIKKTFHITNWQVLSGNATGMSVTYSDTVLTLHLILATFTNCYIQVNGYFVDLSNPAMQHIAQIRFIINHPITNIENKVIIQTRIYPNPFNDYINIEITEPNTTVSISNFLGQEIYSNEYKFPGENTIPLNCSKGIYFITINNTTQKIIKK